MQIYVLLLQILEIFKLAVAQYLYNYSHVFLRFRDVCHGVCENVVLNLTLQYQNLAWSRTLQCQNLVWSRTLQCQNFVCSRTLILQYMILGANLSVTLTLDPAEQVESSPAKPQLSLRSKHLCTIVLPILLRSTCQPPVSHHRSEPLRDVYTYYTMPSIHDSISIHDTNLFVFHWTTCQWLRLF